MLESLQNRVANFDIVCSGEKKNNQNAKKIKSEDKYDSNVVVDLKPEELGPLSKKVSEKAPEVPPKWPENQLKMCTGTGRARCGDEKGEC